MKSGGGDEGVWLSVSPSSSEVIESFQARWELRHQTGEEWLSLPTSEFHCGLSFIDTLTHLHPLMCNRCTSQGPIFK